MTNEVIYTQCKEIIQPEVTMKLMGWIYRVLLHKSIDDGVFLYETDNEIITGFALCRLLKRTKVLSIDKIGVRTDYRKNGIGSVLIKRIKELGYDIKLDVVTENQTAIEFYRKHKFSVIGNKTLGKDIDVTTMYYQQNNKFFEYETD